MIEGVKLIECKLKQLRCSIKGSLKLLDALRLSLEDKRMLHRRQGNKITDSVIGFNSIKMMYDPTLRQGFIMSLFPNNDVFWYPVVFRSRMPRTINPDVTMAIKSTPSFPICMFATPVYFPWLGLPSVLPCTCDATLSPVTSNRLFAIYAVALYSPFAMAVLPSLFRRTMMTITTFYNVTANITYSHNKVYSSIGSN